LRYQTVEELFFRSAPHQLELKHTQLRQRARNGCLIDSHKVRLAGDQSRACPAWRRQSDPSFPMQCQQQPAAYHVPNHTVGLHPAPRQTNSSRQFPPANFGIGVDHLLNGMDIRLADRLSPILEHAIHERSLTVPEIERNFFRIFFAERVCSRGVLRDLLYHGLGESVNGMDKPIARTENEVKILSGQSELTSVHGVVFAHYDVTDRAAEAYAMITLFESGYADQNDIARCFGYSTRTLRRYHQRFELHGLGGLTSSGGRPTVNSPDGTKVITIDRPILH